MHRMKYKKQQGMVYAMTNAAGTNEVIALCRDRDGRLTFAKAYATGGSGTGEAVVDPLQSQGSLVLSHDGRLLFAVNAGSNSISSFRVNECGMLKLIDIDPSGGVRPNSLAVIDKLLYVSNVGDDVNSIPSNVTGFRIKSDGHLQQISGSTHQLSDAYAVPACVVFRPDGSQLVVSELSTNNISVFQVNSDGTLTGPTVNTSSGAGPFGAVFASYGLLLVSEAGANALSSYDTNFNGTLDVISGSVANGQTAVCWVAASWYKPFAYTSNTGSGTITTYEINDNGELFLSDIVYSTLDQIGAPIDSGLSKDGYNFYVLNGNQGSISAFCIGRNGQLALIQVIEDVGLPTLGAQGLAVL